MNLLAHPISSHDATGIGFLILFAVYIWWLWHRSKKQKPKSDLEELFQKPVINRLGPTDLLCKAPPGKFRACFISEGIIYHIGNDVSKPNAALALCMEYKEYKVQIFDDKGMEQIVRGKLIDAPIPREEDEDNGGQIYRNEIPPIQWQTLT
jgi:hypothetical protein